MPERLGSLADVVAPRMMSGQWQDLLTPADVHQDRAEQRFAARAAVLATAYAAHPERFPAGQPHPPARPVEVWINPPKIPVPLQTSSAIPPSPLARAGAFA